MGTLTRKQRKSLLRIIVAAAVLVILQFVNIPEAIPLWPFYLISYLIVGWDVVWKAVRNIAHGQVFDENFLMALATVGAFATREYAEAVGVMLFYQVGELFQSCAVDRSRRSIAQLMDLRPDTAWVEGEDGTPQEVDPEDVAVDAVIVVKPGERIPLDGVVLTGQSALDTAALTGESVPRDVKPGDSVLSGCVNLSGLLRVRVTRPCEESTASRILELVENAAEKKAPSEQFITRFARYYTPCVVLAAAALFLIPSALLAVFPQPPAFLAGTVWQEWLHRALVFLVISCPCALVISVPLSFFGGIGGASRRGILVKGGNYLETLSRAKVVVFDKTGTLTKGVFSVTSVHPAPGMEKEALLTWAALAEQFSTHPIALSLRQACGVELSQERTQAVEELAGYGVRAAVDGHEVLVGNLGLLEQAGISASPCEDSGTTVYVAVDGVYAGYILIADLLKDDTPQALRDLKACGVEKTVMLTGDRDTAAQAVAKAAGVDEVHAQLLPADKVARMEQLMNARAPGTTLAFVGDGINDAPVLARADVGIAMGAMGSDAAIEAADIVLMDDKPSRVAEAIRISRRTMNIVRQNIGLALGVKLAVLALGALGHASMWAAVFADVGVAVLAICNAARCLDTRSAGKKQ